MYAFDFESLKRYIHNTHNNNGSIKRKKISYLRVIVGILQMMNKYERRVSENYKDLIIYNYENESALCLIKKSKSLIELLNKEPHFLVQNIRKFNINLDVLNNNMNIDYNKYLSNENIFGDCKNDKLFYWFCLSLKYLCRNSITSSSRIDISKFIDIKIITARLMKTSDMLTNRVKNELVMVLAYLIESLNENKKEINNILDIKAEILKTTEICDDVREFLLSKIGANMNNKQQQTIISTKYNKYIKKERNEKVVTKTIQTVKSSIPSQTSEEIEFKIQNLINALKSRNRKIVINTTQDSIETFNDLKGDDRSMWRNTWAECMHLYQLASQGQTIKKDDKDKYLVDKFFGKQYFTSSGNSRNLCCMFINRMIAATFLKVSKRHELNDDTIEKLMKCVTDLYSFVSFCTYGTTYNDVHKNFREAVFARYLADYESCECDLVKVFAKKIADKTMIIQTKKGIFKNYKEASRKLFSESEVNEIIDKEIDKIRIDAMNALFNSVLRNRKCLTKLRLKKIENFLTSVDNTEVKEENFKNILIRIISLVDSSSDLNYKGLFTTYLNLIKTSSQNTNVENIKSALNFINGQSRDIKRCQELFSQSVIDDLINIMISKRNLFDEMDLIIEIINNFLGHETSIGLGDNHLNTLIDSILNNSKIKKQDLIKGCLIAILFTAEKKYILSKIIETKLIGLINKNTDYSNYIILILSRMNIKIGNTVDVDVLSCYLNSDDVEIIDQDEGIKFEKSSDSNTNCTPISLMVSKLLKTSIENNVSLSHPTVERILQLIRNSHKANKQTRIIAAKCIYQLKNKFKFDYDEINMIQLSINDDVYDVKVYMQASYSCILAFISKTETAPLNEMYMDTLSTFQLYENMKIGEEDYADEINQNTLETIKCEANKQEFKNENMFNLFEDILMISNNASEKYVLVTLEILEAYTRKRHKIPTSTIVEVEVRLNMSEFAEVSLFVMQNVINNGQPVSSPMLQLFADNFYVSTNTRRRLRSFKLLEKASLVQDLPDDVFYKLEMVKAGFGLERVQKKELKKCLLNFITVQTEERGLHLPLDTMIALQKEIKINENLNKVLEIFNNVSRNKQMLDYDVVNRLLEIFDPFNFANKLIIGIFENMSRNNQSLSTDLVFKLEQALKNKGVVHHVLPIFVLLGQKGTVLTENVIKAIVDFAENDTNLMVKQDLLSSIGPIVQANGGKINNFLKLNCPLLQKYLSRYSIF